MASASIGVMYMGLLSHGLCSTTLGGIVTSGVYKDRLSSGSTITIKGNIIGSSVLGGNNSAGIRLRGSWSGVGEGNTISHNGVAGIILADIDKARPTIHCHALRANSNSSKDCIVNLYQTSS